MARNQHHRLVSINVYSDQRSEKPFLCTWNAVNVGLIGEFMSRKHGRALMSFFAKGWFLEKPVNI
jgi:hypothetical protein